MTDTLQYTRPTRCRTVAPDTPRHAATEEIPVQPRADVRTRLTGTRDGHPHFGAVCLSCGEVLLRWGASRQAANTVCDRHAARGCPRSGGTLRGLPTSGETPIHRSA